MPDETPIGAALVDQASRKDTSWEIGDTPRVDKDEALGRRYGGIHG